MIDTRARGLANLHAGVTTLFVGVFFWVYAEFIMRYVPVVRLSRDSGERELALMRWDLISWWAKDGKIGFSTINAKAETLSTSPAFREAIQRRRCLVPADWFYE